MIPSLKKLLAFGLRFKTNKIKWISVIVINTFYILFEYLFIYRLFINGGYRYSDFYMYLPCNFSALG